MQVLKWVGYVDDWIFRSNKKPTAYIVLAVFEETPKRYKLVQGQTDWDHVQRACDFRRYFNKDENPHIFDSWQQAYDHLIIQHTVLVEKAKRNLEKAEANLQAALKAEHPEYPSC